MKSERDAAIVLFQSPENRTGSPKLTSDGKTDLVGLKIFKSGPVLGQIVSEYFAIENLHAGGMTCKGFGKAIREQSPQLREMAWRVTKEIKNKNLRFFFN